MLWSVARCITLVLLPMSAAFAQEITTTQDTKISQSSPSTNFGTRGWLHVNSENDVLMQFDLSSAAGPVEAELQVELVREGFRQAGSIAVYALAGPWSERDVTWNNQPPLGDRHAVLDVTGADAGQVIRFDISTLVNEWLADPSTNYGLSLQQDVGNVNVVVRSRESSGGSNPGRVVLTPSTQPPGDASNRVTVAPSGGDYASVESAAGNADSGDAWCVRTAPRRCQIYVAPGEYVLRRTAILNDLDLIGTSRSVTHLLAAEDVATAIEFSGKEQARISDVKIVNNQHGNLLRVVGIAGAVIADRVDIEVHGDFRAYGFYQESPDDEPYADDDAATITVRNSTVNVSGDNPIGFFVTSLAVEDSRIYADPSSDGIGVIAFEYGDQEDRGGDVNMIRTTVTGAKAFDAAAASITASSIVGELDVFTREGSSLFVRDSQIRGVIDVASNFYCDAVLDNVTVSPILTYGSDIAAVEVGPSDTGNCPLTIRNSTIRGNVSFEPVEYAESPAEGDRLTIIGSEIGGTLSVGGWYPSNVMISGSRLSEPVENTTGSLLTCLSSFNGNLQPLNSDCSAPP